MGLVIDREAIFTALEALLVANLTSFKTITRRWVSVWDDPGARIAGCPMLVQWEQMETHTWITNRGIGSVRGFSIKLEVYAKIPGAGEGPNGNINAMRSAPGVPNKTTPGSTVLNPLIDEIEAALAAGVTPSTGRVTLGDLVYDCRIEGTLVKVLGDEDPSGLCGALIPVVFITP